MKKIYSMIFFFTIFLLCNAAFITAENDFFGYIDEYLALNNAMNGSYYEAGSTIFWNMLMLNNQYIRYVYSNDVIVTGGTIVFSANSFMNRFSLLPFIGIKHNRMILGLYPVVKYVLFEDGLYSLNWQIGLTGMISNRNFNIITYFSKIDSDLLSYMMISMLNDNYNIHVQCGFNGILAFLAGIDIRLNDIMLIALSISNNKILTVKTKFNKSIFNISYSMGIHPELGASHTLSFGMKIPKHIYKKNIEILEYKSSISYKFSDKKTPFNINCASLRDIESISGIGFKTALKIITKRIIINGYKNYSQIDSIKGIGMKTIEILKQKTYIGENSGKED